MQQMMVCAQAMFTCPPPLPPQLWDIRSGVCRQTFTGHESDINAVTVSHKVLLGHYELVVTWTCEGACIIDAMQYCMM